MDLTLYPDVNAVLQLLHAQVQSVLGDSMAGMIVHGSLAAGDFDPQRSDVDVLVITAAELPPEMLPALAAMHARLTASGAHWATKLEVSYIPLAALRRHDPAHAHHPALRVDGSFGVDGHGSEWIIQRHIIREKGIVIAGPPPDTLIDPVLPDDLRRAVVVLLQEWWAPQLQDQHRLRNCEYQAYAILTMCRMLYTLQEGAIVSKPVAARWAQHEHRERWAGLIQQALAWQPAMSLDRLDDTLALIRYTLERAEAFAVSAPGE
jgi:predicted nucleotidyltransferase